MLRFFRSSGIGKVLMGGIVILIIAVFTLEFRAGSGSPTATLNEQCAVEYARHCVDAKDYYAAFGLAAPRGLPPKESRALSLRKRILDGLAERELLYVEGKRLGLGVSDEVVEQELTAGRAHVSLPADDAESLAYNLGLCRRQSMGFGCEPGTTLGVRQLRVKRTAGEAFDYKLYEREIRIVANRGPREFRATQEREIVAERLRQLVRSRVRIPEAEAVAIYERGRSRAVVRNAALERTWFARFAVDTSDAAVQTWTAANASQVDDVWKSRADDFAAGCPLVSELVVPLVPNALDDEKTPARERIAGLRARVEKGEPFELVAREASSAPSAAFGGRVGCLNGSHGPDAEILRAAADKLGPGALSDIIETPRAFVVLRLEGKLDKASAEREGRLQVARGVYVKFAADEAMRAFANELIAATKAGAKLEELVRAKTDEIARRSPPPRASKAEAPTLPALLATDRPRFEVSPPFTISGNPLPDVEPRESLAARAFALDKPDTIDEKPVETATGLVVLQLKEKTPASREEFTKEKWTIMKALRQAKAGDALSRYVGELRRAAGDKLKIYAQFGEEPKLQAGE